MPSILMICLWNILLSMSFYFCSICRFQCFTWAHQWLTFTCFLTFWFFLVAYMVYCISARVNATEIAVDFVTRKRTKNYNFCWIAYEKKGETFSLEKFVNVDISSISRFWIHYHKKLLYIHINCTNIWNIIEV